MTIDRTTRLSRETLVDRLTNELRQQVLSGAIAPGEALPSERELCDAFGVGRTTVREALKALAAAGFFERRGSQLVVTDPHRLPAQEVDYAALGARLSVRDVFEVRELLETRIVEAAAKNWSDGDLDALRAPLEAMREPANDEAYHRAHDDFHLAIARVSKNPVLLSVYESSAPLFFKLPSFWRVFGRSGTGPDADEAGGATPQGRINGWKRHVPLYEAIARRDAAEAVRLNGEMLDRIEQTLIQRLNTPAV